MIDRSTVDRILDAVRIEEVIGDFVSLRRRGTNYLGLCPFHQDKNPSMSVSSTKGIFKCFSCGKAGNAVTFLMDHEHLSYPDALRYLAKKYHIEIKEKEESPEEIASRMRYESILVVSDFAQKFYQDILWNNESGRAVGLSYFRERRFSDETIRKFGLGYAHNRPLTLVSEAVRQGYKQEYLVASGLCIERDNGEVVDRFYDRVMFPIHSISGRVIAFGGRTLRRDKSVAKYVNSPETEIYVKSNSLYGIFFAKSAIAKADRCILVEGYADVISMHQAGIENVVASSGTSLTVGQIRLIKRFTSNITIIYDGDEAGIKASVRGIDLVLEEGLHVKIVALPPEDDPDTFALAHSTMEIEEYISENAVDFITYKGNLYEKQMKSDPILKSQLIGDIIQSISFIPDPIERGVYVEMVSERFNQRQNDILLKISEMRGKRQDRAGYRDKVAGGGESVIHTPAGPVAETHPSPKETAGVEGKYAMSNGFLAPLERELIYYLLKFGCYRLRFGEEMFYGLGPSEYVTAAEFIRDSLDEDDLVFENALYREMYEMYFRFAETVALEPVEEDYAKTGDGNQGQSAQESSSDAAEGEEDRKKFLGPDERRQMKIIRLMTTGENKMIDSEALDILCETHQVTVDKFVKSLQPEETTLGNVVPKAVMIYKLKVTELACSTLAKEISIAQKSGDAERLKTLLENLTLMNQIKTRFSRELNRL